MMLILWALAWTLLLYASLITLKRSLTFRTSRNEDGDSAPGLISCLKPLKGLDPGLEENLRTFFEQDEPEFELIFCASDLSAPEIGVVRKLRKEYPEVRVSIVRGKTTDWENPKIANLLPAYAKARGEFILISDSNVRVEKNYLRSLRNDFHSDVGLLTAVVAGTGAATFGGQLEETFLGTFYYRGMYLAESAGHPCVIGKCMLFRKKDLDRMGGLSVFGRYLAEDYMAGIAISRLGKKVAYASKPLTQYIGAYSVMDFWKRHVRWGRIRKAHAPLAFALEPFLTCAVSGLMILGIHGPLFMGAHFLAWFLIDSHLFRRVSGGQLKLLPWLTREILHPILWITILIGDEVEWRGKKLKLKPGGLLSPPLDDSLTSSMVKIGA